MTTVNNTNTLAIIAAYDTWQVSEAKAADLVKSSKGKMVDLVIATVGTAPKYDDLMAFRTDFLTTLTDKGVSDGAASQRYTRMMQAVKSDERFEYPKAPSTDAERKRQTRGEFKNLNEAEVQELLAEAIANKDYKTIAKLGREQEARDKMLERADKAKYKTYIKDLTDKVKHLDIETARIVAWVLVDKNLTQVKAMIKSQAK